MVNNSGNLYELVLASFGRCRGNAGFSEGFYSCLAAGLPGNIADNLLSIHRDWLRAMLEIGIGHVLLFYHDPDPTTIGKIASLGDSYYRLDLHLVQDFRRHFIECLMRAVAQNDPDFCAALDSAWLQVVKPGIDAIVFYAENRT